ncbi:hypothetical protein EEB13_30350 [Rhodococcus sp. WS3]|nr:hypothetical protein EEB13_30350 [Rhodococcus sp. WS3]
MSGSTDWSSGDAVHRELKRAFWAQIVGSRQRGCRDCVRRVGTGGIAVDSESSVHGGRTRWELPKVLAQFDRMSWAVWLRRGMVGR